MFWHRLVLFVRIMMCLTALGIVAYGQNERLSRCEIDVTILNADSQPARVEVLLIGTGSLSEATATNDRGEAVFVGLPEDDFRLIIGNQPYSEVDDPVSTRNGNCFQHESLRIGNPEIETGGATVFAGDLKAPRKARLRYAEGVSFLNRQKWHEAEKTLQQAVALDPAFSSAYNALGVAASEAYNFDIANASFRKAIEIRKNYSEAILNFARSLIRQNQFTEAEGLLRDFVSDHQDSSTGTSLLVESLFDEKKFDDIVRLVGLVDTDHHAHDPAIHRYLLEIYRQRGMTAACAMQADAIARETHSTP